MKALGKVPVASDLLTRWAIGEAKCSMPSLSTLAGMPSIPMALVELRPFVTLMILVAEAKVKWNGRVRAGQFDVGGRALPFRPFLSLRTFST